MGWQVIEIPRKAYRELRFVVTGIARGKENDTCISEVELFRGGDHIDLRMPKAVVASLGAETEPSPSFLVTHRGHLVATHDQDLSWPVFNPNGKLVAGINLIGPLRTEHFPDGSVSWVEKPTSVQLWVADVNRARVVKRVRLPATNYGVDIKWQTPKRLIAKVNDNGKVSRHVVRLR